jgi:hypothetical protein
MLLGNELNSQNFLHAGGKVAKVIEAIISLYLTTSRRMKREAGEISLSYAYTSSPSQKRVLKGTNSTESWIPFPVNQERG